MAAFYIVSNDYSNRLICRSPTHRFNHRQKREGQFLSLSLAVFALWSQV